MVYRSQHTIRQVIVEKERKNAERMVRKLNKHKIPDFSYGTSDLCLEGVGTEQEILKRFVSKWFENPEPFLNYKNFAIPKVFKKGWRFSFPSSIDQKDTAVFYESKQPFWRRKTKTAFIIIPHWNPFFWKYYLGTAAIRSFFLPVATYMYFPECGSQQRIKNETQYDVVGPNLGLTIKRFQQDVLNIQRFGAHLKDMGYESVGIWGYSIGSPRALVASLFSNIFDFVIMNFLADSFPQAVLSGVATTGVAQKIRQHVSDAELEELWSPLSPGHYTEYFKRFPNHVRLIQPKYDLVFGEENNRRMVEKLQNYVPNIDIEYGDFGHSTYGRGKYLIPSIRKNAQFVIKNLPQRCSSKNLSRR